MKKIYLAGGMKDGWQDRVIPLIPKGWEIYDPRSHHGLIEPDAYTKWDIDHVEKADILLFYMSPANPSGYGGSVELGYAYARKKVIIFFDEMGNDWRSRYFDMHASLSDYWVTSIENLKPTLLKAGRAS